MTLDCWRSSHCHRGLAGWLPLVFAAIVVFVNTGFAAAAEPQGTPINDPELAALLRPSQPIGDEHLTRGKDDYVYYSAKLKSFATPGFTKRYLAELEDRGVRIRPIGSSPHSARQRITGYDFLAWQEASPDPYTIRFREGRDREEAMVHEPSLRPDYVHPVSVTLDRLVVRLPAEFAKPWTTGVVVPKENQARLHFAIPLPPDAVVRAVWDMKAHKWGPSGSREGAVFANCITVISHLTPAEICGFFRKALEGWGKARGEESSTLTWALGPAPPWAPAGAGVVRVDTTESTLFGTPGGNGVPNFEAAGAFERKTLPHLPRNVRKYLIIVYLDKAAAK